MYISFPQLPRHEYKTHRRGFFPLGVKRQVAWSRNDKWNAVGGPGEAVGLPGLIIKNGMAYSASSIRGLLSTSNKRDQITMALAWRVAAGWGRVTLLTDLPVLEREFACTSAICNCRAPDFVDCWRLRRTVPPRPPTH
jgi:hypothetical protein